MPSDQSDSGIQSCCGIKPENIHSGCTHQPAHHSVKKDGVTKQTEPSGNVKVYTGSLSALKQCVLFVRIGNVLHSKTPTVFKLKKK